MTEDSAGSLPPHELRALGLSLSLVEPLGGPPLPSLATSSPGLAGAAASGAGLAPTLPADDPGALAISVGRPTGELPAGVSLVPLLTPERAASELGPPGVSPGISPALAPSAPSAPSAAPVHGSEPSPARSSPAEARHVPGGELRVPLGPIGEVIEVPGVGLASISPQVAPAAPVGVPASGREPSPAWSSPGEALRVPGGEQRVPFAVIGEVIDVPAVDLASIVAPPLPGPTAALSPPGTPPEPAALDGLAPPLDDRYWLPVDPVRAPSSADAPGGTGTTSSRAIFDPHQIRRDFPILEERVHAGKRLVWLDNAATTQKPRAVIERLTHYYEHENSNVHRAAHTLAARATDAYDSARETTRRFLNAASASEIVFVRGATEGINLIAKAWGKRHVERGDEIVVTHLEHHANIVPWQQLCAEVGARLRVAPVDARGDVVLDEYEKLLCSRTRLVAFTQVSNALGTVTPAREMIEIAHRWGATVLLDGAQAVSHMPVDVQSLDCDFYVFSGHKVFAPTGIGAVFGKRVLLDAMPPWQGGGNMIRDVTFERTEYQDPPWRFEAGTGNIADAAGLGAALDYLLRIGMPTIERHEHDLLVYAIERLATVPGLRLIGAPRCRAGVLSFVLAGRRSEDVGTALDQDGIAVRAGHHCAQPILRRYGLETTVRASLALYNVREDVDALVNSLKRLQTASV